MIRNPNRPIKLISNAQLVAECRDLCANFGFKGDPMLPVRNPHGNPTQEAAISKIYSLVPGGAKRQAPTMIKMLIRRIVCNHQGPTERRGENG